MKKLALVSVIFLSVVNLIAQSETENLYTRSSIFTKQVGQEKMYGLQCDGGFFIGKYLGVELSTGYSRNFQKETLISNMEIGLFAKASTNNKKNLVGIIGFGPKWQSKFFSYEKNPDLNRKSWEFDPSVKCLGQFKLSYELYIHTGFEYGFKSKETKCLLGLRFVF